MKKTITILLSMVGVALGDTVSQTVSPGTNVTLDPSIVYQLDLDCRPDGTGHSFEITTTGNQTITKFDGYELPELASSSITFNLGGEMTFTEWNPMADLANGITFTLNMGANGSWYSQNIISFAGSASKLNLTSTTNVTGAEKGLFTRTLISANALWYSTDLLEGGNITFADETLKSQGYTARDSMYYADANGNLYTGVHKDSYGSVIGLDETSRIGALGEREYAFVLTDNATKIQLMVNVIPEPATASLSLLALIGLAARRRRR